MGSRKRSIKAQSRGGAKVRLANVRFTEDSDGRIIPIFVIPQPVLDDARLQFTGLLARVYNSCDFDLMNQFLNKYYRDDFLLHQELTGNDGCHCHLSIFIFSWYSLVNDTGNFPEGMKGALKLRGRETVGKYWYERMHDSPDTIFEIKKVDITVDDDETHAVIACDFTLSGTVVFPVDSVELRRDAVVIVPEDSKNSSSVVMVDIQDSGTSALKSDFDSVFNHGTGVELGVRAPPDVLLVDGQFLDVHVSTGKDYDNSARFSANDEFAGLRAPAMDTNPILKINLEGKCPVTIPYSHRGRCVLYLDADSLIRYSYFVMHSD